MGIIVVHHHRPVDILGTTIMPIKAMVAMSKDSMEVRANTMEATRDSTVVTASINRTEEEATLMVVIKVKIKDHLEEITAVEVMVAMATTRVDMVGVRSLSCS